LNPLLDAAAAAPRAPGVYFFLGEDRELLYVGKAADLRRRLGDHARDRARTPDLRRRVLLDAVRSVGWEPCADEQSALAREADLIVLLQPAFNASHAEQASDCFVAIKLVDERASFDVTTDTQRPGQVYGTFPHLAKGAHSVVAKHTKAGYCALLRLLWATSGFDDAGRIPARLARSSPPAHADVAFTSDRAAALRDFFSGRSDRLLTELRAAIAEHELAPFTRSALERDIDVAHSFFVLAPRRVRQLRLRHAIAPGPMGGDVMAGLLAGEVRDAIGEFRPGVAAPSQAGFSRRATRERQLRERLRG
jgi:hypothetical protein